MTSRAWRVDNFLLEIVIFCRGALVGVRSNMCFLTRGVFCCSELLLEVALGQPVNYWARTDPLGSPLAVFGIVLLV